MDDGLQLGSYLREQREKKGYSLQEISLRTKIRVEYLQALEEGTYERLPVPTYVRGFLVNCAELLDLSAAQLLEMYRVECPPPAAPPVSLTTSTAVKSVRQPRSLSLRGILAAAALLCLLAGTWFFWPERTAEEGVAASPSVYVESEAASPLPVSASEDAEPQTAAESATMKEMAPLPQAVPDAQPAVLEKTDPPELAPPVAAEAKGEAPSAAGPLVLELQALRPVDVEVAIDGRALQNYSLQAESQLRWRIVKTLYLRADPPAAAELRLNGEAVSLGASGVFQLPEKD